MKQILTVLLIGFLATTPLLAADSASPASASPKPEVKPLPPAVSDFVPIFDGKTLNGWHVSSSTYHTYHGTGGKWVVENGAIVGTQDKPGNGGVIMTDPQFGDFEVYLEMGNDFGPDSGLFLRSTEKGQAYQALIDYHKDGNVMGIYGEFIGNFLAVNYCFPTTTPDIIKIKEYPKFPCPFTPEQWKSIWRKDWNDLRARITGDPPTINTWINGIHTFQWTDTEKRTPPGPRGMIGLQNHGDPDHNTVGQFVRFRNVRVRELDTPDNSLSQLEKAAGWQLLFDGKTLNGWKTDKLQESKVPVEDSCIQPHGSGAYMMVNEQQFGDFILSLDFKISKGCNSGIFVRTSPLDVPPGYDVGFNGIEIAIDDTTTATMHDTGAIYDLVAPTRNAMSPIGQWNHAVIVCDGPKIVVELNGERVSEMNLDEWNQPGKRPDGSSHKFANRLWKTHPRIGYIGLQDHGSKCWYKNIKLLPLNTQQGKSADANVAEKTNVVEKSANKQPHVVFVTGDDEYRSEITMPMIASILEKRHGMKTSICYAVNDKTGQRDPKYHGHIEGLEALKTADLAVINLRFRTLPDAELQQILDYVNSGRPIVGLRTSTHAFQYGQGPHASLDDSFGRDVFGQKWITHHGHDSSTNVYVALGDHPITRGMKPSFHCMSWLYNVMPLHGEDCVPLLVGAAVKGETPPAAGNNATFGTPNPVAWTKTYKGARVFYTSLGHPKDFEEESVRKLVVNGIFWALGQEKQIPADGANVQPAEPYTAPPTW